MRVSRVLFACLGLAGLAMIAGGFWLVSEAVGGGDFRAPVGLLIAAIGLITAFIGLIGWLYQGNKGTDAEDIRRKDLWQGFLQLSLLRKLAVFVATPVAILGMLAVVASFVGNGVSTGGFVTAAVGLILFLSAWPSALTNFKNTTPKNLAAYSAALVGIVAVAALGIVVITYKTPEEKHMDLRTQAYKDGGHFSRLSYYNGEARTKEHRNLAGELSGTVERWYANGQQASLEFYISGRRDGQFVMWHENGQKKWEAAYILGELQGSPNAWDVEGNPHTKDLSPPMTVEEQWTMAKEKEEEDRDMARRSGGQYTAYYANGQKRSEEHFDANGELSSLVTGWYENGNKRSEEHYLAGELEGLSITYFRNGQKRWEGNWTDGDKTGVWVDWHNNGQRERERIWGDGQNSYKVWDRDGKLLRTCVMNIDPNQYPWQCN